MPRPTEGDRRKAERLAVLRRVVARLDGEDRAAEVLGVGRWRVREWLGGGTEVEERWWPAVQAVDRLLRLRQVFSPPDPSPLAPARRPRTFSPEACAAAEVVRRRRRGLLAAPTE